MAKYASYHSLIIFNEHNPLLIQREWIADYLRTAEHWFEVVSKSQGEKSLNKFFFWNCLWRSAASIIHGHMQVTATEERDGKLEVLEKVAADYQRAFNASYFVITILIGNMPYIPPHAYLLCEGGTLGMTVYYRQTTFQQRKYLFELVEQLGNVSEACRRRLMCAPSS